MINNDELLYKISAVIDYLKTHNGHEFKVYNRFCSHTAEEPDSDIVEYAEDVESMIKKLLERIEQLESENLIITEKDLPF